MPSIGSDRRVAAVTGGARGIGLGISTALAGEGFDLAICGQRAEADVAQILAALREKGARVMYTRADISKTDDRASFMEEIRASYGSLHVLVNNAGIAPKVRADILEAGEESFDELVRVNLKGPYFLTQAAARWMIEQRSDTNWRGCIVNITSISAEVASVNRGDYCLTKAALGMSSKLWSVRLAEHGIPVYEVRPGIIKTDMTAGVTAKYDALIAQGLVPQKRWGLPEDVGRAVASLARGDLAYSTGQVLMVDGGMTLQRL
jgi:3-oxoacyl-[acyl-carrier protein] reductase